MAKIDYAKAKRDKRRSEDHRLEQIEQGGEYLRRVADEELIAATRYAAVHQLRCFKCHTTVGPFARAKREPTGRRWALCARCHAQGRTSTASAT